MTLLVTGGTGFVMSNLVRYWLETDPGATAYVLDVGPWDALAERFFAPVRQRLVFIRGDVLDRALWDRLAAESGITHIVHGATITPGSLEVERARARETLETNIVGTLNALECARALPNLRRFVYVSSGAVYGEALPGTPDVPVPEDGRVAPVDFYGVSKHAAEQMTSQYAETFGLPALSVRFSGVYGPMDRPTPGRNVQSIPYRIIHHAARSQPITVSSLEAGGDFIHAWDIAEALARLLRAPQAPRHRVYNVAYGQFTTLGEMLRIVRELAPGFEYTVAPAGKAHIDHDPARRLGRWSDYDIARLRQEFGWQPRPLPVALRSYLDWVREHEAGLA